MKDYTITEIIELCKKFTKQVKQCKDCPVQIFCIKYFAGLPKYWKMPKENKDETNNT